MPWISFVLDRDKKYGGKEEKVHGMDHLAPFVPAEFLDFSGKDGVLTRWRSRGYPYPPAPIGRRKGKVIQQKRGQARAYI